MVRGRSVPWAGPLGSCRTRVLSRGRAGARLEGVGGGRGLAC